MTVVVELLNLCLKDIGITGAGQTASPDDMQDAFDTLGQMLGMWQADGAYVYAVKQIPVTLSGAASYTVGAGGDIDIPRPVAIDAAFVDNGGVKYAVRVIDNFADFDSDSQAGASACYVPNYPLGVLHVSGVESGALTLLARVDLPLYASSYDDVALPPEYAMAIRYSLDELLSVVFQTPLRPDIPPMALKARKIMKRNNVSIPLSQMPYHLPGQY